jgi:acyl carrier protein
MITIEELRRRIEASKPLIHQAVEDSVNVAVQEILGVILDRIFVYGLDQKGQPIGKYTSEQYKKLRQRFGRQVEHIDLNFRGDIFNSVKAVFNQTTGTVGITDSKAAEIAGYLEEKYGVVFKARENEIIQAVSTARDYLNERLSDIVKGWNG